MTTEAQVLPLPFRLVVLDEPVAAQRPRFSRRAGHAYSPSRTQDAEYRIRRDAERAWGDRAPLEGAVSVTIRALLRMPVSIPKKRQETARPTGPRNDADNLAKTVIDALDGVVYRLDGQVTRLLIEKDYARDGRPRWEITVEHVL